MPREKESKGFDLMDNKEIERRIEAKIASTEIKPIFTDGFVMAIRVAGDLNNQSAYDTLIEIDFFDTRNLQILARFVMPKNVFKNLANGAKETLDKIEKGNFNEQR